MSTWVNDFKNNYVVGQSIAPDGNRTATTTGTGVDFIGCDGQGVLVFHAGTLTDGTYDVKVQESKNNNAADESGLAEAYADVAGGALAQILATQDDTVFVLNFKRTKRWVRVVATLAGTTTGGKFSAILMCYKKIQK
jgi:hypothetical protein